MQRRGDAKNEEPIPIHRDPDKKIGARLLPLWKKHCSMDNILDYTSELIMMAVKPDSDGKELQMVSIAEEKRRKIGSNILFYICLVGLVHDFFIRSDNSVTAVTIGFAVSASIGAASALYSKLRIEMLTLLGKSGGKE